ncbi:MAG: DUF4410 domain-containing protein, partial [Opitutaceae bacterium]
MLSASPSLTRESQRLQGARRGVTKNSSKSVRQAYGKTKDNVNNINIRSLTLSALSLGLSLVFAGCGTVSGLTSSPGASIQSIQKYGRISVLAVSTKTENIPDETRQSLQERGQVFADLLALKLLETKVFHEVTRVEKPRAGTLSISCEITRYTVGSSDLRFFVGLGAGSSYFDATVELRDTDTGQKIAEFQVDRNSWFLGGAYA